MATIVFSNGKKVKFNGTPTQADVEEVARRIGVPVEKKEAESKSIVNKTIRTVANIEKAKANLLIGAGKEIIKLPFQAAQLGANIGHWASGKTSTATPNAIDRGVATPDVFEQKGVAQQTGGILTGIGEYFVPGIGAEKAVLSAEKLAKLTKLVKPAIENLAVSTLQQGKVTKESLGQAVLTTIFGKLGSIPQKILGVGQVATGGIEISKGNIPQGVADVGMGLLGVKNAKTAEGAWMNKPVSREAQIKKYETAIKPTMQEEKVQQVNEIRAEASGKEKPRAVGEILFDESIPMSVENDGQSLRYNTTPQIQTINERIRALQETKNKILSDPTPKHDLEALKQEAISSIPAKSALERKQMKKEVEDHFDAEIESNGRYVSDKTLDTIKGGFSSTGEWKTMTPGQLHIRKTSNLLRNTLESSNPNTNLSELNQAQGDLIHANNYLQSIHGSVVRGGLLGKKIAGAVGAVAGQSVPIPIVGPVAGHMTGEALQSRSIDPTRISKGALAGETRSKALQVRSDVEKQLLQNAQNPTMKQLPAGQTRIPEGGTIMMPAHTESYQNVPQKTQNEIVQQLKDIGYTGPLTKKEIEAYDLNHGYGESKRLLEEWMKKQGIN